MEDKRFLLWLVDRLVYVYHENDHTDFVHKLRAIALNIPENVDTPWPVKEELHD